MYLVAVLCLLSAAAALPTPDYEHANLPELPEPAEEHDSDEAVAATLEVTEKNIPENTENGSEEAVADTLEVMEEKHPNNIVQSSQESAENNESRHPEELKQSEESKNSEESKERNHEQKDSKEEAKEDQHPQNFDTNKEPEQGQIPTEPVVVKVEDKIKPGLLSWLQSHFNFFPFNILGNRGRSALGQEQIYIVAVLPDVGIHAIHGNHQH